METEGRLRLADVFVSIEDPRQAAKVEHDLVELLVVAVNAVLVGADTFVEIELWAREKLDWLAGGPGLEFSTNAGAPCPAFGTWASAAAASLRAGQRD